MADVVSTRVILPEGSSNLAVQPNPFSLEESDSKAYSYLDTFIGRPAKTLVMRNVTRAALVNPLQVRIALCLFSDACDGIAEMCAGSMACASVACAAHSLLVMRLACAPNADCACLHRCCHLVVAAQCQLGHADVFVHERLTTWTGPSLASCVHAAAS